MSSDSFLDENSPSSLIPVWGKARDSSNGLSPSSAVGTDTECVRLCKIAFKPGTTQQANADGLSCLPLRKQPRNVPVPEKSVLLFESLQQSPVRAREIRALVDEDPVISRVHENIQQGWRHTDSEEMRPYQRVNQELSLQDGCILCGNRVVVPQTDRA